MTKIKARNPQIASMRLCVPIDGLISIDHRGMANVTPKCAALLVKGTNDWMYYDDWVKAQEAAKQKEETVEETAAEETVQEETVEETAEDAAKEREEVLKMLETMTVAQLKDYAKQAELPAEEWEKIRSKNELKAYLMSKYDEA